MAELTYVTRDTMTAIADAIRAKNGETTAYKPTQMAEAISGLGGGGTDLADVEIYIGDYADSTTLDVAVGAVNVYAREIRT